MKHFRKALSLLLVLALAAACATTAFAVSARRSDQKLSVNGEIIESDRYIINGYNYFMLRDLAKLLNGTASQFDVGYDKATRVITITTNHAYTTARGDELTIGADQSATAKSSTQTIMIDGVRTTLTAYNIGGSNFFQLRELGAALGFNVGWDGTTRTMIVTSTDYESVNNGPVDIVDMLGRKIHLDKPATRIVALTAADCEILFAVGAGTTLVGRGEYCDYPEEVYSVPSVQSGYDTNIEQIIALRPEVLLMGTMAQTEEQVAQLEAAGIRVVVSDAQDIEGVYTAIRMIGALMGRDAKAEQIVKEMKDGFAELAARAAGESGKSIYFEVSPLQWGLWTAGKGTFMNEIAEMIGLKNCFDDVDGWAAISEEQVLMRNPDYIMTITMYYGEGPTPEEEIMGRAGWKGVTAVANGAILNLQNDELSRPAPRLLEGARMLYEFVYGK